MSKTALMYLVGGIVVIGGIGTYMISQPTLQDAAEVREQASGKATGKMSMKDLIAANISQKCTVDESNDVSQSSGVVYVANGKLRGDFQSMASGMTVQSHMIADGEYSYVWTSATNQGFKMPVSAQESAAVSDTSGTQGQQSVDYNQQLGYACEPWTADANTFSLPSGVTFTDMSTMMRDAQSGLPTGR
ncbi:MAG: hypothetical protein U1D31_01910 [Patescibacteria group bacterium]|nr:hypothetical protein [bacterium]MDZ4240861.1 hypothetical protein [Patescibacteria group bacterium]